MKAWDDLTGRSDRWFRTIILSTIAGRLGIVAAYFVLEALTPSLSTDGFSGIIRTLDLTTYLTTLVLAPVLETLILMLLVWLLAGSFGLPAWPTALLVGAAFVPLHGWTIASWSIFPLFVTMTLVQFHWREKGRAWSGFWIVTTIHALGNLSAVAYSLAFSNPA